MLKTLLSWIAYGEPRIWKQVVFLTLLCLIALSLWIARPTAQHYLELNQRLAQQEQKLSQEILALNQPSIEVHALQQLSWAELGEQYALASRFEEETIYFSGKTEEILRLLNQILEQAYQIDGFHLLKSEHKTLLAIEL
jgi:hypothetical protein